MGRLGQFYTKVESKVEVKLPLSGDIMLWHRPSEDEIRQIMTYGQTLDMERPESGVKYAAYILKMLCDKPDLKDESQADIERDLATMDAPDKNEIIPQFNELLGIKREDIQKMINDRFQQRTRK